MSNKLVVLNNDKYNDECAVVGVIGCKEAAKYSYLALYAMQHRGQEGAGIVACEGPKMRVHKDMGLVADVFNEDVISHLKGTLAIGHTRYATCGAKDKVNLQPLTLKENEEGSGFAIAHNGNLINDKSIKKSLEKEGAEFKTSSDTEVILHLLSKTSGSALERVREATKDIKGAFSLVICLDGKLVAMRDPAGVRPLSLGKLVNGGYVVSSETCAFDLIGAKFERDIKPGEIITIDVDGVIKSSSMDTKSAGCSFCIFEYIYFARPDSTIDSINVYEARKSFGRTLARQHAVDADIVIPVPDSGVPAAIGYSEYSGIKYELGLIRNHYVGRTFIEPTQQIRDFGVKVKLNPNEEVIKGKRVVVVDDSIVRGTTSRKIVTMLKNAGAKEVHFRVSSPPTIQTCHYGIDTPSEEELIANKMSIDEIEKYLEVDSLGYLSVPGIYESISRQRSNYCDACFSGEYPLGLPDDVKK